MNGRTLVIACGHEFSLALLDADTVLARVDRPMVRGHAEAVVPEIQRMLAPFGGHATNCSPIIVETGPGSFTGLRIGLAAGSALALVWGAELKGVRSTQLVAADVRAQGLEEELLVMLAAPRGQVWLEKFAVGGLHSTMPPVALTPEDARELASTAPLVAGSAVPLLGLGGIPCHPRAAAAASLPAVELGEPTPLYVRIGDSVASH